MYIVFMSDLSSNFQSTQGVKYGTRATVTDPFEWYGGKVVPFKQTVYAEVRYRLYMYV